MCLFWYGRILENGVKLYVFDEKRYELLKNFYNFVFRKGLSNSTYDIFWSILELSSKNLQTINAGEGKEKREPFCQISNLGMQIVRATVDIPLYGICMDIPLKNWEYHYPVIQQMHYWAFTPEETVTEKHTRTSLFITASFAIARTCKQPRRPWTDEHIKKLWCADTMEYYLTTKRNTSDSVLMRWMNLESVI